jgi:hypothetical protein
MGETTVTGVCNGLGSSVNKGTDSNAEDRSDVLN